MTKQELKAKIDKLENGIKSKATPSNLIAPLKAQKAKLEKELEEMESAEKKAVKTKKVSKVAEKIKAAKTSVAKKTPAKAPAKEERKKDNIARDGDRKSLPAGKRISKTGKVYYETRANRSDKQTSKKPYLAKGGNLKIYDKENSYRLARPSGYIEKDILRKVKFSEDDFVGNFGWKTTAGKLADGYLFKLDEYDQNLVKNIKLKEGEKIYRYFNRTSAIGGMKPLIKINTDKELLYFLAESENDEIIFETKGVQAQWIALIQDKMADGGKLPNGKYKYVKGDEGMFQGDEVRVVKYHNGDRTYEYNIIDEDGKVKTHGVSKAERFENQFRYFPKMADGGEVSQKINSLLNKLEDASKNGRQDEFDEISNKIHEISDNQGLSESEYNKWDEIRSSENEKRISKFSKMADGGETEEGVDLFEDYENIPTEVQKILDKHSDAFEDGDYRKLEKANNELKKIGYTFEYGLDGEAYDLRKIGQKGKMDEDEYAKGGYNYKPSANLKEDEYQKLYKRLKERKEKGENLDSREEYAFSKAEYILKTRGLLGKEDKMADGGEIDWGADLGGGFSVGNDVYITDPKSLFQGKTGFVVGVVGRDLLVTIMDNGNERSVVVSKKGVEKLDAPEYADGGYVIFEGHDHYNDKPLYQVISKDEDNDYEGEFHDNREDAEKELNELKNKDMKYANGGEVKDSSILQALNGYNSGLTKSGIAENLGLSNYRFGKYASESQMNSIETELKNLIELGYVEEGGVGYKITQEGARYLDTIPYQKREKGGYMANGGRVMFEAPIGKYVQNTIKDFYINTYPTDDLGQKINGEATFDGLNKVLDCNIDVYEYLGVGDSLVRERVFEKLAEIEGVSYDVIYDKWLASDYAKGGYMAKGGQVPAHFGSGKNIEVFGYETKNFDICGTAVKEFEAAVDIMKDSKELEKESLAYCAKYVDNLFGIEKGVVEGGIGGELNFSHAVSDIMSAATYNFRAGMAINLYSFVPQHLMEIALRLAKAEKGGLYALGGMTAGRWYKDKSGEEFKFIGRVDSGANKGRFLFTDGQKSVYKDLEEFEGGKPKETKLFGFFEDGGSVAEGNYEMLMSNIKAIKHHAEELAGAVTPDTEIEAWVLSKSERAETDLSDITHYLDGLKMEKGGYMADGGQLGKETITLKSYNIYGKEINSGDVIVDYDNKTIELPSGKTYKVENDYKYTIKALKSKIKASGGINGLVKFLKEINTSDSPFNPSFTNQLINGFDKYAEGGELEMEEFYLYDENGKKYEFYKKEGDKYMFSSYKVPFGKALTIEKSELQEKIKDGKYKVVASHAKGGETNYTKKWKVYGITIQGKRFEKEITLGRMSDKNDVMNALKRMPDTQIREVTSIQEVMAKGGDLNSIKEEYLKNEDENAHSENVVLLAKHFGTKEDLAKAKEILALHEKEGHLSSENGKKRQQLHLKLIDKATKEMAKEGIEFEKGGYMAKGGIYSSDSLYILKVSKDGKEVGEERFRAKNAREAREMGEDFEDKYKSKFGGDLSFSVKEAESKMAKGGEFGFKPYGKTKGKFKITYMADGKKQSETWETKEMAINNAKRYASPKMNGEYTNIKVFDENGKSVEYMAMGGKVKFADKVKAVQESLLKRKKVAPQVQKDYGKTYNKAEAKESAQRIVGSRMAQLKEKMAKKKMAKGGTLQDQYDKLKKIENEARNSYYKARDTDKWHDSIGNSYMLKWEKQVAKLKKLDGFEPNYNFGDVIA